MWIKKNRSVNNNNQMCYNNSVKKNIVAVIIIALAILVGVLAYLQTKEKPPMTSGPLSTQIAPVDKVDILMLESFPIKINAVVQGYLPDFCTNIDQIIQKQEGNMFFIVITMTRPADQVCVATIEPFEEVIALDVLGLKAGRYTVNVNEVIGTFELTIDNVPLRDEEAMKGIY